MSSRTAVFTPSRYSHDADGCLAALDARLHDVEAEVHREECWRKLVADPPGAAHVTAMLREVMLRVSWYQPHTTEAGFHMLGRLPKQENHWLRALLNHKAEEAEHGLWALRDYLALGGTPERAEGPPSPASFAVAGVWWRMAYVAEPLGYLGAEYLFEALTARVAPPLCTTLERFGLSGPGSGFIVEHATEDIKHTNLIRHLVADAVTKYPHAARAILDGFDCFRAVYPIPVWREAHASAMKG